MSKLILPFIIAILAGANFTAAFAQSSENQDLVERNAGSITKVCRCEMYRTPTPWWRAVLVIVDSASGRREQVEIADGIDSNADCLAFIASYPGCR